MADNSNYYSGDNTNPGFTTGNNTVQGQQGGMSVGQPNNFDIGSILQGLLQTLNTPQQSGNSQGGMSVGVSPSQQIQQDVATKAYTKNLQNHAENTPPQILANLIDQWGQQGGGTVPENNQGATSQTQSPDNSATSAQQAQQQPSVDDQIAQINKQAALNIANRNLAISKPQNFTQRFGNTLAKMEGGVTQADQLQNLGAGQKISGAEPLQPKDVGELNANSYKAALDASHNAAAVEQQKIQSFTDLYSKLNETKGVVARTLGNPSGEQDKVLQLAKDSADNLSTHLGNLRQLIKNRPTFNSQGTNPQAQETTKKINQGKVGKYTLVSK